MTQPVFAGSSVSPVSTRVLFWLFILPWQSALHMCSFSPVPVLILQHPLNTHRGQLNALFTDHVRCK
jgi:hypothetical protein